VLEEDSYHQHKCVSMHIILRMILFKLELELNLISIASTVITFMAQMLLAFCQNLRSILNLFDQSGHSE